MIYASLELDVTLQTLQGEVLGFPDLVKMGSNETDPNKSRSDNSDRVFVLHTHMHSMFAMNIESCSRMFNHSHRDRLGSLPLTYLGPQGNCHGVETTGDVLQIEISVVIPQHHEVVLVLVKANLLVKAKGEKTESFTTITSAKQPHCLVQEDRRSTAQ